MVIILPDKANGLEAMEKKLEPQFFQSTSTKLKNIMEVQLSLPRFKTTCELDLKPIFQKVKLNLITQNYSVPIMQSATCQFIYQYRYNSSPCSKIEMN